MLKLPDKLTAESFLKHHWQKKALFMPAALERLHPSITRNELGWLATLDDVESRIVFVDRTQDRPLYRVESGPFDDGTLSKLPKRDWTLLVHDVEKHVPAMRAMFRSVSFIPDWRIDDLMVSFAAPGGGVGPHRDHYDVFLCQGIGERRWHFTDEELISDPKASSELALVREFEGHQVNATEGDVLYLPPGAGHWGTANRACMTYSIGMRAPEAADLAYSLDIATPETGAFYRDPDLGIQEAKPGYISDAAARRALTLLDLSNEYLEDAAVALGVFATQNKDWLKPDRLRPDETGSWLSHLLAGGRLDIHGMTRVAFDDRNLFVNGAHHRLPEGADAVLQEICSDRRMKKAPRRNPRLGPMLSFLLAQGAFEIPENS